MRRYSWIIVVAAAGAGLLYTARGRRQLQQSEETDTGSSQFLPQPVQQDESGGRFTQPAQQLENSQRVFQTVQQGVNTRQAPAPAPQSESRRQVSQPAQRETSRQVSPPEQHDEDVEELIHHALEEPHPDTAVAHAFEEAVE